MYKPLQYMRAAAQYNRAGEKAPVGVKFGAGLEALTILAAGGLAAIVGGASPVRAEGLIGPSKVYASTGVQTHIPGINYTFENGVYTSSTLPRERWKFNKQLKTQDGDLGNLFKHPKLYNLLGKAIEQAYHEGRVGLVGFDDSYTSEIAITIKVGDEWYVGFKKATPELLKMLNECNNT